MGYLHPLANNSLGNMLGQHVQQQAGLSQYQNLYAAGLQNSASAMLALAAMPAPRRTSEWERSRARHYAEECELLIGKLLFWAEMAKLPLVGLLAEIKALRIAARVESTTDEIERWIEMAAAIDKEDAGSSAHREACQPI